jgi:hypothetical protein
MGKYFALTLRFDAERLSGDFISPLFDSSFYRPTSIGGCTGGNWLLAGYELNDFVGRMRPDRNHPPRSIEIIANDTDAEYDYLQSLADTITSGSKVEHKLSPFETTDPAQQVSFIEKHLDKSIVDRVADWLLRFPRNTLHVYGTLALAVREPNDLSWHSAYREVFGTNAYHFLDISFTMYPPAQPEQLEIMLFTGSEIWLREAQALSNRVGKDEAIQNLANLAVFAKSLKLANESRFRSASPDVEGTIFYNEQPPLYMSFLDLEPFDY